MIASDELNQFLMSHPVIHVEKTFHADGADGYWSFCLQWQDGTVTSSSSKAKNPGKIDYRTILSDGQFSVFAVLREQRKRFAEKDGVPVYAVARNDQLAAMVRGPITTKSGLQNVPGFGEAKVDRYGKAFLETIQQNVVALTRESERKAQQQEKAPDAKSPESESN